MKNKIINKMKKYLEKSIYIIIALLVGITAVYAGSLTPPGSPQKTMKSLSDLYELIDTGSNTPSDDFDTPETISSTMYSLGAIYDLMVDKIEEIDSATILTGTTIFGVEGEATAGTPAPTFASSYQTTYSCEALALDPEQPAVTLRTICELHTGDGCSWGPENNCLGGEVTPGSYMTWYAGVASCSVKSDEGSTDWRLPTYTELVGHYLDNNDKGGAPTGFVGGNGYWATTVLPNSTHYAYGVNMGNGNADSNDKSIPSFFVHCAH